jgi:agmatine/peptidylarginine deiminase
LEGCHHGRPFVFASGRFHAFVYLYTSKEIVMIALQVNKTRFFTSHFFMMLLLIIVLSKSEFARGQNSVILLSAPSVNEPYYSSVFNQIIAYDIAFANKVNSINGNDRVIILTDAATKPYLQPALPDSVLIVANVADIWIRDFSPVITTQTVKFDYRPSYLSIPDANFIDNSFRTWFLSAGLNYNNDSPLILDGGNFVWNRADKAILTQRVFLDNPTYTQHDIDSMLKFMLDIDKICYLPEEVGDISGHSDGMVMFADTNHLFVNTFDEPFRTQVLSAISNVFTGINITEVPYPYDTSTWNDWPSACGIYLNSLVTQSAIYMPLYGLADDSLMLDTMQAHTNKQVVCIDASPVCYMGGSVRCLTMVATGSMANTIMLLAGQHPSIIAENAESEGIIVTPNPFSESTTLRFFNPKKEIVFIEIIDICGKREALFTTHENSFLVERNGLAAGVYLLKLTNAEGDCVVRKIVIR